MKLIKENNHFLLGLICIVAVAIAPSLHAVKCHTLDDLNNKKREPSHFNVVLNGNHHENVEVHPDFSDPDTVGKFISSLRKGGITSDQEILEHLKHGYQETLSSLVSNNQLHRSSSHKLLYVILASWGIMLSSFIVYKIMQYYKNKKETEALVIQDLQKQQDQTSILQKTVIQQAPQ